MKYIRKDFVKISGTMNLLNFLYEKKGGNPGNIPESPCIRAYNMVEK